MRAKNQRACVARYFKPSLPRCKPAVRVPPFGASRESFRGVERRRRKCEQKAPNHSQARTLPCASPPSVSPTSVTLPSRASSANMRWTRSTTPCELHQCFCDSHLPRQAHEMNFEVVKKKLHDTAQSQWARRARSDLTNWDGFILSPVLPIGWPSSGSVRRTPFKWYLRYVKRAICAL